MVDFKLSGPQEPQHYVIAKAEEKHPDWGFRQLIDDYIWSEMQAAKELRKQNRELWQKLAEADKRFDATMRFAMLVANGGREV